MSQSKAKSIFLAFLACGLLLSSIPQSNPGLESIKITGAGRSECDFEITNFDCNTEIVDLDLECFSDIFKISVVDNSSHNYKIQFRYETSITIQHEGPHIDLINWKHYRSPWKTAMLNPERQFVCQLPDGLISKKFPKVTMSEVRIALAKVEPTWVDHIKHVKAITEYPLDVGISRIYFRILAKRNNTWRLVKTFCYNISLGC
ncbi:MAG: hypothetical protein IPN59_11575 [Holophaga sp.]|nr:hypothetical protein [Holophaga sp.]